MGYRVIQVAVDSSTQMNFEEIGIPERKALLWAYGYSVEEDGTILSPENQKLLSEENPLEYLKIGEVLITPSKRGSLDIRDGTPTSISKYLRENEEG